MAKKKRAPELTFQKHIADYLVREHKYGVLEQSDITAAIVNGRQPPQLNAKKLMRLTARLPADWIEQRALLGFR